MPYFAKIEQNIVVTIVVANQQSDCGDGTWLQVYKGNANPKRRACKGFNYDSELDAIIAPKPFKSWSLDENFLWQSPSPEPDDEKSYKWEEDLLSWVEVE